MANKNIIKIGTKVKWSGSWNTDPEQEVIVEGISKCEFEGDKNGTPIDEIPFDEKDNCIFDLDNRHWCYGEQIVDLLDEENEEIDVCIRFIGEVYIKGKTIEDIRRKWYFMPIFSEQANKHDADVTEITHVERVDDESYTDLKNSFVK